MGDEEILKDYETEGRTCSAGGYEARCWGCGLQLVLPFFAPVFKCGWCGAVTVHQLQSPRKCIKYAILRDRILVMIVLVTIFLFIGGGMWCIFPILFPGFSFGFFFNSLVTVVLSFNILINYVLAFLVPAGHPPYIAWGRVDCVGKGSLDGHKYCCFCKGPKCPRTHHCQTCKACVVDMDHHCPFIGNCVGANNRRHFIRFLLFTVLGSVYLLLMSIYAGFIMWPNFLDTPNKLSHSSSLHSQTGSMSSAFLIKLFIGGHVLLSARALTLAYLSVASLSVIMSVGLLLYHQLSSIYAGQTFLDKLQIAQGSLRDATITAGWDNFKKVFGNDHFIFWVFPKSSSWSDVLGTKFHHG